MRVCVTGNPADQVALAGFPIQSLNVKVLCARRYQSPVIAQGLLLGPPEELYEAWVARVARLNKRVGAKAKRALFSRLLCFVI